MAMVRVEPVQVRVRTDWFNGSPREITWGARVLPVLKVVGVREESAAFPIVSGPRTVFDVATRDARLTLCYRHRNRRWVIEGYEDLRRAA